MTTPPQRSCHLPPLRIHQAHEDDAHLLIPLDHGRKVLLGLHVESDLPPHCGNRTFAKPCRRFPAAKYAAPTSARGTS
jgi:hypothetical protein